MLLVAVVGVVACQVVAQESQSLKNAELPSELRRSRPEDDEYSTNDYEYQKKRPYPYRYKKPTYPVPPLIIDVKFANQSHTFKAVVAPAPAGAVASAVVTEITNNKE